MKVVLKSNDEVLSFAEYAKLPGWYIDYNGCYCCIIKEYLFCVFLNSDSEELEFTVDTISESGHFDNNLEWETPKDCYDMIKTIQKYVKKYINK